MAQNLDKHLIVDCISILTPNTALCFILKIKSRYHELATFSMNTIELWWINNHVDYGVFIDGFYANKVDIRFHGVFKSLDFHISDNIFIQIGFALYNAFNFLLVVIENENFSTNVDSFWDSKPSQMDDLLCIINAIIKISNANIHRLKVQTNSRKSDE